jgi:hypothetical protein
MNVCMGKKIALTIITLLLLTPYVYCEEIKNTPPKKAPSQNLIEELNKITKRINDNSSEVDALYKKMGRIPLSLTEAFESSVENLKTEINGVRKDLIEHENKNDRTSLLALLVIPLIASIIGAIIAGYFLLKATKEAHKNALEKQEIQQKHEIRNLLQAIHDEIIILWDTYMWGVGDDLEKLEDGKPFNVYYPLTQEYFTTYNNNSRLIGTIENGELRKEIVETYTMCRALVDSYRLNNDFVQKYENWHWLFVETKEAPHAARAQGQLVALTNYAKTLKEIHFNLKVKVKTLAEMIDKEINKEV